MSTKQWRHVRQGAEVTSQAHTRHQAAYSQDGAQLRVLGLLYSLQRTFAMFPQCRLLDESA